MRFFIQISYTGTNYHGWQIQPNANSIQAEINKALSTLLNNHIQVMGAGRTDAGVHAFKMFAHFDYHQNINDLNLLSKLNKFLPDDIAIHKIDLVSDDANCRFDAISRTYEYHIQKTKDPFNINAYLLYRSLNIEAMNAACSYLLGKQDFTSFSKVNTQTHTNICNIMSAKWKYVETELIFSIRANRFLRNMVRAIVGTLLLVGMGKIKPLQIKEIILSKDRGQAGVSVPAHGLFLVDIKYNERQ